MSRVVQLLGGATVSGVVSWCTRNRLRTLTFHTIPDPSAFARQLDLIADRYRVVSGAEVATSLTTARSMPPRSLWITFDDGDISVVRHALPVLRDRGLSATAFVCAGWIDTQHMPWWVVLERAWAAGMVDNPTNGRPATSHADLVQARLAAKRLPDRQRRQLVDEWSERLRAAGAHVEAEQWTQGDISAWLAAGNDIGNHTWDHPILDRCDDAEQRRQVNEADARLRELGAPTDLFAWPNGDPAPAAADELERLGYRLIAECDHRLTARRPDPKALSRLKIDAAVGEARTRAILSGAHSGVFHLQSVVRRRQRGSQGDDAVT